VAALCSRHYWKASIAWGWLLQVARGSPKKRKGRTGVSDSIVANKDCQNRGFADYRNVKRKVLMLGPDHPSKDLFLNQGNCYVRDKRGNGEV
jgi:hypothetical protein